MLEAGLSWVRTLLLLRLGYLFAKSSPMRGQRLLGSRAKCLMVRGWTQRKICRMVLLNYRFDLLEWVFSIQSHMRCESVNFLHGQNLDSLRTLDNTVSPSKWSHQACSRRYEQVYIQQDTPLLDGSSPDHKSHLIRGQDHQ